eukprot:12584533-Prorocentrum_lima.AAC.1
MAVLEPSLKDLSDIRNRIDAQGLELGAIRSALSSLMGDGKKDVGNGDSGVMLTELNMLKLDITQ